MSPSPEPLIVVSRPCPRRAGAIERLVAATLDAPDREAIERHLKSCPRCRGYREWLRLEARTARSLAGRTAARVSIEKVRHDLEQQIAHLRAAEAAQALVRLAEWYIARREDPDPRIYARRRPRPRSRSEEAIRETLERWKAAPWSAAHALVPTIEERADRLLAPPDPATNRAAARALLDLAADVDPMCYRARSLRADIISDAHYGDVHRFEEDVEALLSASSALARATGLSQKARYMSMTQDDLGVALQLFSRSAEIDLRQPNDRFNAWLHCLCLADQSGARTHYRDLVIRLTKLRHGNRLHAERLRAYRAAIESARAEGDIAAATYRRWSRRVENLLQGDLS